jgi:hypothetical protein
MTCASCSSGAEPHLTDNQVVGYLACAAIIAERTHPRSIEPRW